MHIISFISLFSSHSFEWMNEIRQLLHSSVSAVANGSRWCFELYNDRLFFCSKLFHFNSVLFCARSSISAKQFIVICLFWFFRWGKKNTIRFASQRRPLESAAMSNRMNSIAIDWSRIVYSVVRLKSMRSFLLSTVDDWFSWCERKETIIVASTA